MIISILVLLALALAAVNTGLFPTFTEDFSRAVNVSYILCVIILFVFIMDFVIISFYNTEFCIIIQTLCGSR